MNDMSSEEVDRISSLPEDVLHHIFSFLNTKHTVQTCVLSKRWRYFWTSLPFLNFVFDPRGYYWLSKKLRSFQRFVTSVFFFRNDSNLQRLTFSCKSSVESSFLNMVIHYAVSHNVQELTIKACADRSFEWPPCLLTCQSLKTLHVDAFYGSKGSGMEIIANCPNLENLVLVNITDFNISAPKLRNLEILSDPNPYQADAKIVVSTPKLTSFKYEGCNPLLGSLEDLSCLEKVHIALLPGFPYCDLQDEEKLSIALNLFTTLSVLRNAKSLTLSLVAIKVW
ncbi:hypothetical protein L1049_019976 [Liquidambar formosana]|uniref:F-box domain-containing protein n=1 Tax=Liquidambar formosana TaxID=63359 RepID=A0AAP0S6H5_LIQFO